jgi:hypothetical protein
LWAVSFGNKANQDLRSSSGNFAMLAAIRRADGLTNI